MGKIKESIRERIKNLEKDRHEFSCQAEALLILSAKYENTFHFYRLKLAVVVCELRIEIWKALIGKKNENNR